MVDRMKPETELFYDKNGLLLNELLLQIFNRMVLPNTLSDSSLQKRLLGKILCCIFFGFLIYFMATSYFNRNVEQLCCLRRFAYCFPLDCVRPIGENTIANLQSCAKTGYQMETGIFASYISGSLSENLPVTI